MGKMKEIAMMHEEGFSAEYIANVLKTDTLTIKKILYGDKKWIVKENIVKEKLWMNTEYMKIIY